MIQIDKEGYVFNDVMEFELITIESSATLFIGIVLDKEIKAVRVLYLDLAHQISYSKDDFEKSEQLLYKEFGTLGQAREFYNEIKHPIKITQLVNKHKRYKDS